MGKVVLINRFDVPAEREEEFLGLWLDVSRFMRCSPLSEHRLHRPSPIPIPTGSSTWPRGRVQRRYRQHSKASSSAP